MRTQLVGVLMRAHTISLRPGDALQSASATAFATARALLEPSRLAIPLLPTEEHDQEDDANARSTLPRSSRAVIVPAGRVRHRREEGTELQDVIPRSSLSRGRCCEFGCIKKVFFTP